MEASPNEDESYDIFGMRLAERAYPEDVRECAIRLRSLFFSVMPQVVVTMVNDAEGMLKATTSGVQKHLPFFGLTQMAKDLKKRF